MLGLSKSMVTCSIVGDAYENRWWYIALLVGYKATAEHYRGSELSQINHYLNLGIQFLRDWDIHTWQSTLLHDYKC